MKFIKPFLSGKDIKRYRTPKHDKFLIFIPKGWTLKHYKNSNDRLIRSLTLLNDAKYLLENSEIENRQEIEALILHYYGIIYYFEKRYSDALKYFKHAQDILDKNSSTF